MTAARAVRAVWAVWRARRLHRQDLCRWCEQYLWLAGEQPQFTPLGALVHAHCYVDADQDECGLYWGPSR